MFGIFLGFFAYDYVWFVYTRWLAGYLVIERKLSKPELAFWTSVPFLIMSLVILVSGAASDLLIRRGHSEIRVRKTFIVAGLLVGCLMVPAGLVADKTTSALPVDHFSLRSGYVFTKHLDANTGSLLTYAWLALSPAFKILAAIWVVFSRPHYGLHRPQDPVLLTGLQHLWRNFGRWNVGLHFSYWTGRSADHAEKTGGRSRRQEQQQKQSKHNAPGAAAVCLLLRPSSFLTASNFSNLRNLRIVRRVQ